MARYFYSLVENTYVVRQSRTDGGAEYLTPEGEWIDYSDLWDVIMNGRPIASEEEALEKAKKIFERRPEWWAWESRMRAGDEAYRRGDYGEAEKAWKAQLEFEVNMGSNRSVDNLAILYQAQGKYDEAEPLYERSLAMTEKFLGPEHPEVAQILDKLASLYQAQGKHAEAEPLHVRALAIVEKALGPTHVDMAESLENYAALLHKTGRDAEAAKMEARAKAIRKPKSPPGRARRATGTRLWQWLTRRRERTAKEATAKASRRASPARATEFDRSKIDGRTKVGKAALAALKKRGRKSKTDLEALAAVGYPGAAAKLRAARKAQTKSKPAAKRKTR
jgi:tetratricopeptide (TPR) repeat protein